MRGRALREWGFLKEDVRKVTGPTQRAGLAVVVGVALVAAALSAVGTALAAGFVGVALVLYGLLFVDVDAPGRRLRR